MKHWNALSLFTLSIALALALAMSALFARPAYADDSTPPPSPTATTDSSMTTAATSTDSSSNATASATSDPSVTATVTPAATTDASSSPTPDPSLSTDTATAVATDSATAATTAATDTPAPTTDPTDAPTATAAASSPTASPTDAPSTDSIAGIPANTDVVALDASGNPLPLASQDAADVIATGDPIWCPAGVSVPVSGGSGCSPSFTKMSDLIAWMDSHNNDGTPKAGVIWIEKIYTASGAGDTSVTLDGDPTKSLSNWANFDITLRGAWNGLGTGTIDTTYVNPSTFNAGALTIMNWNGNVTLSDITVDNGSATAINPNSVPGGLDPALYVDTSKNVSLTRVNASSNSGTGVSGAYLRNVRGTGSVTVKNSEFSHNALAGLRIDSKGTVTLNSVNAWFNAGDNGALINNYNGDPTASPISIVNSSFDFSGGSGLIATSNGILTLNSVVFDDNTGYGALMDNTEGTGAVSVTNSTFDGNGLEGLSLVSRGAVTLDTVDAEINLQEGAFINNAAGTSGVTLLNTDQFGANKGFAGLEVSTHGAFSAAHLIADSNSGIGAYIVNAAGLGGLPVTISGNGEFDGDVNQGLYIATNGAVTLNNIVATADGQGGVFIDVALLGTLKSPVSIKGVNDFNSKLGKGLEVLSFGQITLNDVTASSNGTDGIFLDNSAPPAGTPPGVSLLGYLVASGNGFYGIRVNSQGAVTGVNITTSGNGNTGTLITTQSSISLNTITASGNNGTGASLDNTTGLGNITLLGVNTFDGNIAGPGLAVQTRGSFSAQHLIADHNSLTGASIANTLAASGMPVTISGSGEFEGNAQNGLNINSNGIVTLNSLVAEFNSGGGATVANNTLAPASVFVNGDNDFTSNGTTGLSVISWGAITLHDVVANTNVVNGVSLDNSGAPAGFLPGVSVQGFLTAIGNAGDGLNVKSLGAVQASNLTTSDNAGRGAVVDNSGAPAASPKSITIQGTNVFNDNSNSGLFLNSRGAITVSNATVQGNGMAVSARGAVINNQYDTANGQKVTFQGNNLFDHNAGDNLEILSYGAVTLNNMVSSDSINGSGALVFAGGGTAANPVVISGLNVFDQNEGIGLVIDTNGAVSLSQLTVSHNRGTGVTINNENAPVPSNVTLSGYGVFDANNGSGLSIGSAGSVVLQNVTANLNSLTGLEINNALGPAATPRPVTISGTNSFDGNAELGLAVLSQGAITLSNVSVLNNGTAVDVVGAQITNRFNSGLPEGVTITGNNQFSHNSKDGLTINSYGPVTLANIIASNNGHLVNDVVGSGVAIVNNGGAAAKPVQISGVNLFNQNDGSGLTVTSDGTIALSNATASYNGATGVFLSNGNAVQSNVTLSGYGVFEWNASSGLAVVSKGSVAAQNLNANHNGANGVLISTIGVTSPQSVTLGGVNNIMYNGLATGGLGLLIFSDGNITLNDITASHNYAYGAYLDNFSNWDARPDPNFTSFGSVSITGFGTFLSNGTLNNTLTNAGLYINTEGSVMLNHVVAAGNGANTGYRGIFIWARHNVTLVCSSAYGNFGTGLQIDGDPLFTVITLNGFEAYLNNPNEAFAAYTHLYTNPCP